MTMSLWLVRGGPKRRTRRRVFAVTAAMAVSFCCAPTSASGAQLTEPSDFNGDGYADLVVGVPGETLRTLAGAGAVQVIYGAPAGLASARSQFWTQDSRGVKGRAASGNAFGSTHTSGDFDGDGYADLAVGGSPAGLGSITVLFGSRSGLTARDQLLTPAASGGTERWGGSLTAGDFNGDGRADLAVGADTDPTGPEPPVGTLTVLPGGSRGLMASAAVRVTSDSHGLPATSAVRGSLAEHLAAGDVTGDGRDDLVLSIQSSAGGAGVGAYLLVGSAEGITTRGSRLFAMDDPAMLPADTAFSQLGFALALGDFDSDGHADLALGDFDAGPPGMADCQERAACPGAVLVLPGTPSGPTTTRKQLWHQDSAAVPGTSEGGDAFGYTLAAGDLNGDGRADLVVGVLGEDLGSAGRLDAGAVNILYGSSTGLTGVGAQLWTQDSPGVQGRARQSDNFGSSLAVLDVDRGRSADLAVAARGEDIGGAEEAGRVHVLYGSSRGVTARDQRWDQDSPGIAGHAEAADRFSVLGS